MSSCANKGSTTSLSNCSRTSMNLSRTTPSRIDHICQRKTLGRAESVIRYLAQRRVGYARVSLILRIFAKSCGRSALIPIISNPSRVIAAVKCVEHRHFLSARRAPGRPVIHQNDLAAHLAQIEFLPSNAVRTSDGAARRSQELRERSVSCGARTSHAIGIEKIVQNRVLACMHFLKLQPPQAPCSPRSQTCGA